MAANIEAVYLPHNEPYLGQPHLVAFDKAIPPALRLNLEVAQRTFVKPLAPLQIAATEIIPQGISIALSIRELIRQAYLYSAAILIRPLIERAGTIHYLRAHPQAVTAWRDGWPRRSQPSFEELLSGMHPAAPTDAQESFRTMLHKLVHSDPAGSVFNMFDRPDGVPVFSCGKMLNQVQVCNLISIAGRHYLERLVAIASEIFPPASESRP
ncbi:MAG: hypothetical protein WAK94_01775 [Steroidobacteraceae bacterium]